MTDPLPSVVWRRDVGWPLGEPIDHAVSHDDGLMQRGEGVKERIVMDRNERKTSYQIHDSAPDVHPFLLLFDHGIDGVLVGVGA